MLAMSKTAGSEPSLAIAADRLVEKRLLKPGDRLSQRLPEQNAFLSIKIAPTGRATQEFEWKTLSGTPKGLHHRIYAARPDVGAIAEGAFTWTRGLVALNRSMPAVFDEQVRHLGAEAKLVAAPSTDERAIAALANGANAYCLDDVALCFGMGLDRLLFNLEILEKCAECFVLASCATTKVKRIPWLVRFIANGRLKKDQKDAAARHQRGERSIMKAGY